MLGFTTSHAAWCLKQHYVCQISGSCPCALRLRLHWGCNFLPSCCRGGLFPLQVKLASTYHQAARFIGLPLYTIVISCRPFISMETEYSGNFSDPLPEDRTLSRTHQLMFFGAYCYYQKITFENFVMIGQLLVVYFTVYHSSIAHAQ